VDPFFTAYAEYQRGDYRGASGVLETFWKAHPVGGPEWAQAGEAGDEGERIARTVGVEFGTPPCYYALRMLTECLAWKQKAVPARPAAPPIRFTVILIGHSHGIQPTTLEELHEQRGRLVRNTLDPRFREAPEKIIDDCFGLLFEYLRALTDGRLAVETSILQYPHLDVPMRVRDDSWQPAAELSPETLGEIWGAIGEDVKASVVHPLSVAPAGTIPRVRPDRFQQWRRHRHGTGRRFAGADRRRAGAGRQTAEIWRKAGHAGRAHRLLLGRDAA